MNSQLGDIKLIFIHNYGSQLVELTRRYKQKADSTQIHNEVFYLPLSYHLFPFNISDTFQAISKNAVQQPVFESHTPHLPMVFPREDKQSSENLHRRKKNQVTFTLFSSVHFLCILTSSDIDLKQHISMLPNTHTKQYCDKVILLNLITGSHVSL